ncbi:MAG: hypothetical protein AAFR61_18625 [Bacteroidota bacterium]
MYKTGIKLLWSLLLMGTLIACDRNTDNGGGGDTPDEATVNFGGFEGTTYTNNFFKISVTLPPDWITNTSEENRELEKQGMMQLGMNPSLDTTLTIEDYPSLYLMVAKGPGSEDSTIANVGLIAEKINASMAVADGQEYLTKVKAQIEGLSNVQIDEGFPKASETLQGWSELNATLLFPQINGKLFQKIYARLNNGYVLQFSATYKNEAQEKSVNSIIESLKLD